MGADSYFIQGYSHNICEDYAVDGLFYDEKIPYVIICDGCSSSENTDIGSRVLAKSIEKNLLWLLIDDDINLTSHRYIVNADSIMESMNLDIDCLNSTAILLYKTEEKYIVNAYGDGVIVAKDKNGEYEIIVLDYPSGAPSYLSYSLNTELFNSFKERHGIIQTIQRLHTDKEFNFTCSDVKEIDIESCLIPTIFEFNTDGYDMVTIFSDGIQTFNTIEINGSTKNQKYIGLDEVLKELLSFKNTNGEFVKRRFKRFVKNCDEKEWDNFDDVSMGSII